MAQTVQDILEKFTGTPVDQLLRENEAALCRQSFRFFYEYINGDQWLPGWHIDEMAADAQDIYDRKCKYEIVNMPAQHGKSAMWSKAFPVWVMMKSPKFKFVLASYGAEWAERISSEAKEIVEEFGWIFNVKLSKTATSNSYWELTNGASYTAIGVTGGLSGRRADGFVLDDPYEDWARAWNEVNRQNIETWVYSVMRKRMTAIGWIVAVHTRWHPLDITGHFLNQMGKGLGLAWKHRSYPAIMPDGKCLWPERYPQEYVEETKRITPAHIWQACDMQSPIPAEGTVVQMDWLRYWHELPAKMDMRVITVDMNFQKTKKGSFACFEAWALKGSSRFLVDQWRGRLDYAEVKREFKKFCDSHPDFMLKLVEKKANGAALISDLQAEIPGIVAIEVKDSKEARFWECQPVFEARNVLIPYGVAWVNDWIAEICGWSGPGSTPNNDQIDCCSMALERLKTIICGDIVTGKSHRESQLWTDIERTRG